MIELILDRWIERCTLWPRLCAFFTTNDQSQVSECIAG